jgi:hypothetical protein
MGGAVRIGSEDERKVDRINLHKNFELYKKGSLKETFLKINGNYRLCANDLGEVLLFRSSSTFTKRDTNIFHWRRVPFLKRSAELFHYFQSPLFMSKVLSNDTHAVEERISYFTLICTLVASITDNIIRVEIFSATNPFSKQCDFEIDSNLKKKLIFGKAFQGLFKESIVKQKNEYHRKFELIDFDQDISSEDVVAHMVTLKMYHQFLITNNMAICSESELSELIKKHFRYANKVTNSSLGENPFFHKYFLDEYFREIDGYVYYIPYIFKEKDNKFILSLINYITLREKKILTLFEQLELTRETATYGKYYYWLKFKELYTFFQRRTLIDKLNERSELWII